LQHVRSKVRTAGRMENIPGIAPDQFHWFTFRTSPRFPHVAA
jgi:hypothetical protein